jgi:hypothetical protein
MPAIVCCVVASGACKAAAVADVDQIGAAAALGSILILPV